MITSLGLLSSVADARRQYVEAASGLTYSQSQFRSSHDVWSVSDITEHLVWAEMGGINGIWKALQGMKNNKPVWTGEAVHHGLTIGEIISKTWKEKEQVPEIARPRWGGPVEYWIAALIGCQALLEKLFEALDGHDLERVIYPHIISGPLNVIQRMEFLRFHMNRHQTQVENIKKHPEYPGAHHEQR